MCNKHVKFGAFFDWAIKQRADYVATGHYAQKRESGSMNYDLRISEDKEKDQSYFLWTLTQKELARTLFPVGGMKKPEVRKLAAKLGLPTAEKKDSQGLCFIGKVPMKEFLGHYIKGRRGDVQDGEGNIIGWHDGAVFLTIGERHGFTITKKTTHDTPLYVVAKDVKKNTVTVSPERVGGTERSAREIKINQTNWVSGQLPQMNKIYGARIRYRQPLEVCRIVGAKGGRCSLKFDRPQIAVTAGQSFVLYDGEVCLGGGIIAA